MQNCFLGITVVFAVVYIGYFVLLLVPGLSEGVSLGKTVSGMRNKHDVIVLKSNQ